MPRCKLLIAVVALSGAFLPFGCGVDTAGQGSLVVGGDAAAGTGGGGAGGASQDASDDQPSEDAGAAGAPADAPADAPVEAPVEACAPTTCSQLAFACGDAADGCGKSLHCGDCTAPDACHGGTCAQVIFVDQVATGAGDGSSWQDAFTSIAPALAVAKPSMQIWVAKGTYKRASAGAQAVVAMVTGVALYGHFNGTEAGLVDRDPAPSAATVLDGESAVRVVTGANDAVLDGFVLLHGSAVQGGGLYANNVHGLTVANCRFDGDHSVDSGGAVYAVGSDLTLQRSVVTASDAASTAFGGGIYLLTSTAIIDHCEVSHNVAGTGGGLYANVSKLTVTGTRFDSNQAVYSQSGGGGAFVQNTTGQFTSSVFTGNAATLAYGGGLYNETASPSVVNCTFWGNTAALDALDVFDNVGAKPRIVNSILWSQGSARVLYDYVGSGPADVSYSDVRGGWTGAGNLDVDPAFMDAPSGDLHLSKASPCIDAADGDAAPSTDADDQPRSDDPGTPNTGTGAVPYADIGAFESQ